MRLPTSVLLFIVGSVHAATGPVGVITDVEGGVNLLREDYYLAADKGVEVVEQDVIETSDEASAQVDMVDGSILRVGSDSRLMLSNYTLDEEKNVVSASLDVLSGWLRFAVAKLNPDAHYDIGTPVMTIGVRGTEGVIEADNEYGGLELESGEVNLRVAGGEGRDIAVQRVTAGEYVSRVRGYDFNKHLRPPPAFRDRMPKRLEKKLARRAHKLKRKGVPPRIIRQMTRDDARRFMQQHPHFQEHWQKRFRLERSSGAVRRVPAPRRSGTRTKPMSANPAHVDRLIERRKIQEQHQLQRQHRQEQAKTTGRRSASPKNTPAARPANARRSTGRPQRNVERYRNQRNGPAAGNRARGR